MYIIIIFIDDVMVMSDIIIPVNFLAPCTRCSTVESFQLVGPKDAEMQHPVCTCEWKRVTRIQTRDRRRKLTTVEWRENS